MYYVYRILIFFYVNSSFHGFTRYILHFDTASLHVMVWVEYRIRFVKKRNDRYCKGLVKNEACRHLSPSFPSHPPLFRFSLVLNYFCFIWSNLNLKCIYRGKKWLLITVIKIFSQIYLSIYLSIKLDLGLKNLIVFRLLKSQIKKCIKEEECRRVLVTTPTSTDIKHIKLVQPSHFYLINPA